VAAPFWNVQIASPQSTTSSKPDPSVLQRATALSSHTLEPGVHTVDSQLPTRQNLPSPQSRVLLHSTQ
jgi:hypothetical protein